MTPAIALLMGSALLMAALALWLWQRSTRNAQQQVAAAVIERQIGRHADVATPAAGPTTARRRGGLLGIWNNALLRAGVMATPLFHGLLALWLGGLPLLAWLMGAGGAGAVVAFSLALAGVAFKLWWKADKRRRTMILQLPGFIDAVVRLITIGNSLGAAFHTAVPGAPRPLVEVLERANQLNRAGMDLDRALTQAASLYRLRELELVGAVVGVALRFGGKTDMVLERMAGFMRDLQQARDELHALSAETRLSAWILGLLPLLVGGFIVVFNNDMFMSMWHDPVGQRMLVGAVALQIAGSYWLYRMAKSI